MVPVALTIAGSDPSGGAGVQADLKTFHQFGVYGEAVITLLTVQNTVSVERVDVVPAELVHDQLRAVLADIPPAAAKTGALGSAAVIETIAATARDFGFPLVVDPVMISKHGLPLMTADAVDAMRLLLLPKASLLTPNLPEAARLTGEDVDSLESMRRAARRLVELGSRAALVKGGHLAGSPIDVLFDGRSFHEFVGVRVATAHTHGTGCTYSAAIVAGLAAGSSLVDAIAGAKSFINNAITSAPGLGHGHGPVNHFAPVL